MLPRCAAHEQPDWVLTSKCKISQVIKNAISVNFGKIFYEGDLYVGLNKSFGFYDAVGIFLFSTDLIENGFRFYK